MADTITGAEGTDTIADTFMAELGDREIGSLLDFDTTDEPELVEADDDFDTDSDDEVEEESATPDENTDDEAEDDEPETNAEDDDEVESPEPDTATYRVKVDGEEVEVTLEEALAGYQRQADYTRKTQELAAERDTFNRLDTALALSRDSFDRTIAQLREAYGYKDSLDADTLVEEDPLEAEIRELKTWKAQTERAAQAREVEAYVAQLKANDPELDEAELYQYAIDTKSPSLKVAYEALVGRRLQAKARADAEAAAKAATEAKTTAKRKAKVSGGARKSTAAITKSAPTPAAGEDRLDAIIAAAMADTL